MEQGKGKSVGTDSVVKEGLAEKVMFELRYLTQNAFITLSQILYLMSCQRPPNLFLWKRFIECLSAEHWEHSKDGKETALAIIKAFLPSDLSLVTHLRGTYPNTSHKIVRECLSEKEACEKWGSKPHVMWGKAFQTEGTSGAKPWGWEFLACLRKSVETFVAREQWGRENGARWDLRPCQIGHCKPGRDVWFLS